MKVRQAKISGSELYELEYRPRDYHSDMKIRMFFDIESYRHLLTEYVVRIGSSGNTYYTLTETFGDFKKIGSLTLPHGYTLDYSISGLGQSGFLAKWNINVQEIGLDTPDIPQNLFKAE
jgi:hypothetical protein